jgi:cardiolipin synthase
MDWAWLHWMAHHAVAAWGIFLSALHVVGLFLAVHAVMTVRTSQGAIAWSLLLITLPLLGIPLYVVFGKSRFEGYIRARRTGNLAINHVATRAYDAMASFRAEVRDPEMHRFKVLEKIMHMPFTGGNDARLLVDGEQSFKAMFEAIDRAKRYVLVHFFIIRDDQLGEAFKARLLRKAAEGVEVFLLYDQIGCHGWPGACIQELRKAGVRVEGFSTPGSAFNRFQLNFRNHRKIVIADGRVGFVGGANVGDEYMGRSERFGPWRDTFLQLEGPAVQCLQLVFLEDWYSSTHLAPDLEWTPVPSPTADRTVIILPTGPTEAMEHCSLMFLQAINSARHRLWITSPYFVPDTSIVDALQLAALRGVDVRIMLPEKPDHLLVYLSAFSYFDEMEAGGVKLYRYQPGFMHQKVFLVDDDAAAVGTANLDNRSFRLNFELTALVLDREFARNVEQMLDHDFAQCRRITMDDIEKRPFWFKLAVNVSRLLAPVQ